jgi:hypothetical protein
MIPTLSNHAARRRQNEYRSRPDALRLCARLRGRTPNEIAALPLGGPLPTRLDRRRGTAGRQSADVDASSPYDRPFGRAGPRH